MLKRRREPLCLEGLAENFPLLVLEKGDLLSYQGPAPIIDAQKVDVVEDDSPEGCYISRQNHGPAPQRTGGVVGHALFLEDLLEQGDGASGVAEGDLPPVELSEGFDYAGRSFEHPLLKMTSLLIASYQDESFEQREDEGGEAGIGIAFPKRRERLPHQRDAALERFGACDLPAEQGRAAGFIIGLIGFFEVSRILQLD